MRQLKIAQSYTSREGVSLERYLQEVSREHMIGIDEEIELTKKIRKGDREALEKLTRANLRFVVSVAKQYQGQGLGLIDLINEGNVGLVTAAKRFDETRGFKFISYAVWWIRQSILQALAENSRIVRIPMNQIGIAGRINKFYNHFVQTNERMPSAEEVSEALGIDIDKVRNSTMVGNRHVSVDAPIAEGENEGGSLLDVLGSRDVSNTDRLMAEESLTTEVVGVLKQLPERERKVVSMFYGIGGPEMGLDEIGRKLHLSRERVRQIKEKAIMQLRKNGRYKYLKSFLG